MSFAFNRISREFGYSSGAFPMSKGCLECNEHDGERVERNNADIIKRSNLIATFFSCFCKPFALMMHLSLRAT